MICIPTKFHVTNSNELLVIANTTKVKGNFLTAGSLVICIVRK
jgi:UDP-N-acetyl-D-mannosaminuronate dehydrogenase